MEDKMVVLGGEVGYVAGFPDDFTVGDITEPKSVFDSSSKGDIEAKISFYMPDDDKIREVRITGVQVVNKEWEPSLEDRKAINYHTIARLFAENGLDMHDIKKILEWALQTEATVHITREGETDLYEKVDKIHHLLGGME